jgi:catechol 2,3-dioxygenase-like lactoylglutathione lyase family enzyme
MSIDYIMIGSNDLARSRAFYDAVMPHIGAKLAHDFGDITFGYETDGGTTIWIARPYDKQPAVPANGSMPGFRCASQEAVNAAHAAALDAGGSNEGDPGLRPAYGPGIYIGYVRDPDGNKMSFIHHDKGEAVW